MSGRCIVFSTWRSSIITYQLANTEWTNFDAKWQWSTGQGDATSTLGWWGQRSRLHDANNRFGGLAEASFTTHDPFGSSSYFCNNFVKTSSILIIFGKEIHWQISMVLHDRHGHLCTTPENASLRQHWMTCACSASDFTQSCAVYKYHYYLIFIISITAAWRHAWRSLCYGSVCPSSCILRKRLRHILKLFSTILVVPPFQYYRLKAAYKKLMNFDQYITLSRKQNKTRP